MLVIPGSLGGDTCDGVTRRELLRVGGSAAFGLSLANMLGLQRASANQAGGPGFGKAKSVILIYLQGGPSHLDLWDPKDNVPDNIRSVFKDWIRGHYPSLYVEYKGRSSEWYGGEVPTMMEWMSRKRRMLPLKDMGRYHTGGVAGAGNASAALSVNATDARRPLMSPS